MRTLEESKAKYNERANKLLNRRFVLFFRLLRVARLRKLAKLCEV